MERTASGGVPRTASSGVPRTASGGAPRTSSGLSRTSFSGLPRTSSCGEALWRIEEGQLCVELGFCSLQAPLARVVEWHELDLERELGSGSFGEVSLCRLGGGEKVAVKRLLRAASPAATAAKDFLNELRVLGQLEHPHIVKLAGAGLFSAPSSPARPFLVLEAVLGSDLRALVTRATAEPSLFTTADALKWALQIAEVLAYLHARQPRIIFRDLKLENVMVDASWDVKLIDFGLAREVMAAKAPGGGERFAMTGKTGSLKYMAPETLRGEEANETIDQYAFSIVTWELMSRKGLLYLRTQKQKDGQRVEITPEMWSEIVLQGGRPALPGAWPERLRSTLAQCWHKNPDRRPAFKDVVVVLQGLQTPELCTDPSKLSGVTEAATGCACCLQ
jgi:serine/threonine protein kinase